MVRATFTTEMLQEWEEQGRLERLRQRFEAYAEAVEEHLPAKIELPLIVFGRREASDYFQASRSLNELEDSFVDYFHRVADEYEIQSLFLDLEAGYETCVRNAQFCRQVATMIQDLVRHLERS